MKPHITALCLTFGRVECLNEVIQMFLDQTYDGPKEMIVYNTFMKQRLIGTFPNVTILNASERPPNLGACRNKAITFANPGLIVTWDDDDAYLPNHLENFTKHYEPGINWIWHARQFYMESYQIRQIVPGTFNSVAFTKEAWNKVGKYPDRNSGEDRDFVSRLTATCTGKRVELQDRELSFIYGWGHGEGVYHTSGHGDDTKGAPTAHERIEKHTRGLIVKGLIPTGDIYLEPALKHDYAGMKDAFLNEREQITLKKNSVCFVQLGKFGDIANMLPIAKHCHDTFTKPYVMVSKEFASILDGVSYVEPFIVDITFDKLQPAMELARRTFTHVIQSQIWALDFKCDRLTDAYNLESWRQAGFLEKFRDWMPVFDRRDTEREAAFVRKVKGTKPLLVVNYYSASSPYPHWDRLQREIVGQWRDTYDIVDISNLRLDRPYDLLGLFDAAAGLVSVDTLPLHLAPATNVPIVALCNHLPWLGSAVKGNVITVVKYDEPLRFVHRGIKAISTWKRPGSHWQQSQQPRQESFSDWLMANNVPFRMNYKDPLATVLKPDGTTRFYHSGNLGDIIYAVQAIKAAGGGDLIIGPEQHKTSPCMCPTTKEQFDRLWPLLSLQRYLRRVEYSPTYPEGEIYDLNRFRNIWVDEEFRKHQNISTLAKCHFYELGIIDKFSEVDPWIECHAHVPSKPFIIHRSPRYNAPQTGPESFPWPVLLARHASEMLFVGIKSEWEQFQKDFHCQVEFRQVSDFLELAGLIAAAKCFVGNQSFPLSLAIAMGKTVRCEAYPPSPDCRFDRETYSDQLLDQRSVHLFIV